MPVDLLAPVLGTRIRSVNFFNGRLLAGEDLTTEQKNNRIAHALLGKGIGDGVVYGLEVSESTQSSTTPNPVLSVNAGLAINKNGGSLLLEGPTEVSLVRPTTTTAAAAKTFKECTPTQTGTYIAGAGVYLLTIGPTYAGQGLAEVNGISTATASCNTKYNVPGVHFRLVQLDLTQAELNDVNHLRNLVAYKCFGLDEETAFLAGPFEAPLTKYGLIDGLRTQQIMTNCEVPIAVLYWTATSGIVFIDMWAVRRSVTLGDISSSWQLFIDERALNEASAGILQFEDQLTWLQANGSPQSLIASDYFRYLPPVGIMPVSDGTPSPGFDHRQFFSTTKYRDPVFVNGARVDTILRQSALYRPIDLESQELIWLYRVRENREPPGGGGFNTAQPYMIFVTGHAPYYGDAHYQVARWDYSNYS